MIQNWSCVRCCTVLFILAVQPFAKAQTEDADQSRDDYFRSFIETLYAQSPIPTLSPIDYAKKNFSGLMELGHICSYEFPIRPEGQVSRPEGQVSESELADKTLADRTTARRTICPDSNLFQFKFTPQVVGTKDRSAPSEKRVVVPAPESWVDAVGRLDLLTVPSGKKCDRVSPTPDPSAHHLWGSAFIVATDNTTNTDLVMTSCHAVAPLLQLVSGVWTLQPPPGSCLFMDYGYRTSYFEHEALVSELAAYSQGHPRLDVVLLKVVNHPTRAKKLPLSNSPVSVGHSTKSIGLVGYPDFLHPVDPRFDESYGPYKTFGDAKFFAVGRTPGVKGEFVYYDTPTTAGQSGSPVFTFDDEGYADEIVGVHVCCTAYWWEEPTMAPASSYEDPCGVMRREKLNKAVTMEAIRKDKGLCPTLTKYGASSCK